MRDQKLALKKNAYLYEVLLENLLNNLDVTDEYILNRIQTIALHAQKYHCGRLADGKLENIALKIGQKINNKPEKKGFKLEPNTTVHVATSISTIGGHTRVMSKWAEIDKNSIIVLTNQINEIGDFIKEYWDEHEIKHFRIDASLSIIEKSIILRNIGKQAKRIILHQHPNDVIPICAFAKEINSPVILFNHAHFTFSLGSTISDGFVNTFEYFRKKSINDRLAKKAVLLESYFFMQESSSNPIDKKSAKLSLGYEENDDIILSMAQSNYFKPTKDENFFKTIRNLIIKLPKVKILIVGLNKDAEFIPLWAKEHPQIIIIGIVENPILYFQASDICLESFPFPSLGVLYESTYFGEAFPVPSYRNKEGILKVDMQPLLPFDYIPKSEEDLINYISRLFTDKEKTRKEAILLKQNLASYINNSKNAIDKIYRQIDKRTNPKSISTIEMKATDDDIVLASLRDLNLTASLFQYFSFKKALTYGNQAVKLGLFTKKQFMIRIIKEIVKLIIK